MNETKLTIGMPVFNDKDYVAKAVSSILSQSYRDFLLIISDDCSTDGSELICREFAEKDTRIKYIRQEKNIGISRNMKFLLNMAETSYFMWAADDDLWDVDFISTLIEALENNPQAVSAMTPTEFIDENDILIESAEKSYADYSGVSPFIRLKKLIIKFDDCFGYGIFRLSEIKEVKFPVWKWINKKCPYNNIYPTLCFYLTKGDFILAGSKPRWLNRLKPTDKINHKMPYLNAFLRYLFAFVLRKMNLIWESIKMIRSAKGSLSVILALLPYFTWYWLIKPSKDEFMSRIRLLIKGEISFF